MKDDEIGGAHSTYELEGKLTQNFGGENSRRDAIWKM
jgi:hypothetical protein